MTLWLILSLMTAAAMFAVLWPLSRRGSAAGAGHEVAVYRDQLAEVDRDLRQGLIGPADAEAARLEISRRLLAAAGPAVPAKKTKAKAQSPGEDTGSLFRRRAAALVALIALPVLSAALYLHWGSPTLPGMPLLTRQDLPLEQRSIESMVAQVEAHLEQRPNDGRGWEVVGPVYMKMGRFDDAVRARANVIRILGATAARESDLGEAQAAAANGVVTAESKQSFERALKLDPADPRAQYFIGLAALQDGREQEAARLWRAMLETMPANAPYRRLIQQSLARIDPQAAQIRPKPVEPSAPQPGPSREDLAAAEQLTPEQRVAMVRGMVERLADRLKADGSDFEGWLRLVRAYVVMGDADKAREALDDARKAIGADADKNNRLDALAQSLGIKG